jgi:hypothetical protein
MVRLLIFPVSRRYFSLDVGGFSRRHAFEFQAGVSDSSKFLVPAREITALISCEW